MDFLRFDSSIPHRKKMGLGNALSWPGRNMPLTRYPCGHTAGIAQESEEVSVNVF